MASRISCPNCGSKETIRIAYGLPGPELMKDAEEGKVALGGCCVSNIDPNRHCNSCGHRWATRPQFRINVSD